MFDIIWLTVMLALGLVAVCGAIFMGAAFIGAILESCNEQ